MKNCKYLERALNELARKLAEQEVIYSTEDHDIDLEEEIRSIHGVMKRELQKLFYFFVKKNGYVFKETSQLEQNILALIFRVKFFSFREKNSQEHNHTSCKQKISINNFKKVFQRRIILKKEDAEFTKVQSPVIIVSHCLQKELLDFLEKEFQKIGIEKFFVAGGGTEVFQIIKQEKPDIVIGIACQEEVKQALQKIKLSALGIIINVEGRCSERKNSI